MLPMGSGWERFPRLDTGTGGGSTASAACAARSCSLRTAMSSVPARVVNVAFPSAAKVSLVAHA